MSNFRAFTYRLPNRNEPVIEAGDRGPLAPYQPTWSSNAQPLVNPLSSILPRVGVAAGGLTALGVFGRSTFRGRKGWDYFHQLAERVEEFSPGRVFRTFQISQAIRPFTTSATAYRFISPEALQKMAHTFEGWAQLEHLEKVIGQDLTSLGVFQHGLTYREGSLYLGNTKQVILRHAFVIESNIGQFTALQKGYLRSVGKSPWYGAEDLIETAFTRPVQWQALNPEELATLRQRFGTVDPKTGLRTSAFWIGGGHTRRQAFGRFMSGYGTTLVERMNQLARAPFEIPPFSWLFNVLPVRFGVRPGSGLRTLARMTGKLGIGASLLYGAYSYLDYAARQSEMLDKTILSEGITAGAAKLWTNLRVAIAKTGEAVGAQDYVERQERIAPKSTQLSTLLAFPLMGGIAGAVGGYAGRLVGMRKLAATGIGFEGARQVLDRQKVLYRMLMQAKVDPTMAISPGPGQKSLLERLEDVYRRAGRGLDIQPKTVSQAFRQGWRPQPRTRSRFGDLESLALSRAEKDLSGIWGRAATRISRFGTMGRGPLAWLSRKMGYMTPTAVKGLLGIGVGFGLALPFLPGALLPKQRSEELEAIYSGRKPVPIRKGRWWEFGRSTYEGENIMYYRPHWYPRMLARGRDKAIYGEKEPSPLEKFYLKNFTYELEKQHYFERPYPVTGTAFQDVPLIGPILSATIGRFVKPPRLMHTEDWQRTGINVQTGEPVTEYAPIEARYGYQEAPGELPQGAPVSPYGAKGVLGEQMYRMTEMIGLPGFTFGTLKERLTGEETFFAQEAQLESAQRLYGAERAYWDLEVGGGLGTTELFRRLYPHRRREIPLYNPIRNMMPEWLPGPGERSPDFLHGDPYTKVQEGEIRLPGAGYAAFYPGLQDVAPADYPLIHKFKILADIAPYSTQFSQAEQEVKRLKRLGQLSEQELAMYETAREQLKARREKKQFHPYLHRERAYATEAEAALSAWNKAKAESEEQPSAFEQAMGRYWEVLSRKTETPFEYLTPLSPWNKLVSLRTAVEDYESTQVYGTKNAFWGNPVRDFLRPFGSAMGAAVGLDTVPEQVTERRKLEEYFDILKYVKNTALAKQAQQAGAEEDAAAYEEKRRETLFGVNPYTYNYSSIYRSLPRRERDYFNAFVKADLDERERLLEILPDNEKELYKARWALEDAANVRKAIKKGLLTEKQTEEAQAAIDSMYSHRRTEGMPADKQLWAEYLSTRYDGESYADWYRRVYLLAEQLEGRPLPGPDWIGWHPMVDLEDIKLRVVQGRKENPIDYDIWPDQERLLARRPSVAEGAGALEGQMSPSEVRQTLTNILSSHQLGGANISITPSQGQTSVDVNIQHDRSEDIEYLTKRYNLN